MSATADQSMRQSHRRVVWLMALVFIVAGALMGTPAVGTLAVAHVEECPVNSSTISVVCRSVEENQHSQADEPTLPRELRTSLTPRPRLDLDDSWTVNALWRGPPIHIS